MKSKLAKARDDWLQSDEGDKCSTGPAYGRYLHNRITRAFEAGWNACEENTKKKPET